MKNLSVRFIHEGSYIEGKIVSEPIGKVINDEFNAFVVVKVNDGFLSKNVNQLTILENEKCI